MDEIIYGNQIDGKSRCIHYDSELDIVAIKTMCCNKYYACVHCHNEKENHDIEVWNATEFNENAIMCGSCRSEFSIDTYVKVDQCPNCNSAFNPRCSNHHHYYFEEVETVRS